MEVFFEMIFDIIVEGSIELTHAKKVPMFLRIIAAIIVSSVFLLLEVFFIILAVNARRDSNTVGWIVASAFAIAWIVLIIYKVAKEYKAHKSK